MTRISRQANRLQYTSVELEGVPYAILPAALLVALCRKAGISASPRGARPPSPLDVAAPDHFDGPNMARRIADRRKRAGLTQAQLASHAGVRVETVNRIERGHVTPDFGTIRKLVQAMLHAEGAPTGPLLRHSKGARL